MPDKTVSSGERGEAAAIGYWGTPNDSCNEVIPNDLGYIMKAGSKREHFDCVLLFKVMLEAALGDTNETYLKAGRPSLRPLVHSKSGVPTLSNRIASSSLPSGGCRTFDCHASDQSDPMH